MSTQNTNYDSVKNIIRNLIGAKLSACQFAVCNYLIDQQYGYNDVKGIIGDSSGYGHISKIIRYSKATVIASILDLCDRHIITKEINATKYGNRYCFNNPDNWIKSDNYVKSKANRMTSRVNHTS